MMRCPITYETISSGQYSDRGLKLFSRKLTHLDPFPHTREEQLREAGRLAAKLSIQGVQPKLSVRLNASKALFEIVDKRGTYILKPPNPLYPFLPQNEDVTMRLAAAAGIEVPLHAMIYAVDGSLSYIIKRFDRFGRGQKTLVEDFGQLSGHSRRTKYESSMEKVAAIIEEYCTFPELEKRKLLRLLLFCFLVGNDDMHLKNFSTIEKKGIIQLSPAYDLLNSAIVLSSDEEFALPLKGKKSRLRHSDLIDYYACERLNLRRPEAEEILGNLLACESKWKKLIEISFLPTDIKEHYLALLKERLARLKNKH